MNNKFVFLISLLVMVQFLQSVLACPSSYNGIRIVYDEDCSNGRRSLGCNAAGYGLACRFCGSGYRSCEVRTNCTDSSRRCCSIGKRKVVWDESCYWNARNGCNAGGQGQACRFA